MGAKKFNFALNSAQLEIFSPEFCIFGRTFSDKHEIFRQTKS